MKKHLIILASGTGARFGANCPKRFVPVCGKMIIEYTLAAEDCGFFDDMVLVVSTPYIEEMRTLVAKNSYSIPVNVVEGGASRKESCERGVAAIEDQDGVVVIHNGVQPFISKDTFEKCLKALETYPAVTSGVPCIYTVLVTNDKGTLESMLPRTNCFGDLGPECFQLSLIRRALEIGKNDTDFTNLTGLVLKYQLSEIHVVEGESKNIKVTYPEDVIFAERIINGK